MGRPIKPGRGGGLDPLGDYDERAIMRAWEHVVTRRDGACPAEAVRPLIEESWHRCAERALDAGRGEAPLAFSEHDLEQLRHASRELRRAACESFARVGRLLEGTEAMLILTDRDGVIVETVGDRRTLDHGRRIHLEVGGVWNESVVGTNGIGTALWTGEPVFVHAAEHFCAGIKPWTCVGVPIRDPFDGQVMGVVDLSGLIDIFRRHNTALVALAAAEIESAMARRQGEERTRLLESFLGSRLNTGHTDGVILLDRKGRVIYSRGAPEMVRLGGVDRPMELGLQLVDAGEGLSEQQLASSLPSGLQPRDVNTIRIDGEVSGAALVFRRERSIGRRAAADAGLSEAPGAPLIVGRSPALQSAMALARRVAGTGASLLIEGETGVGKELFARLVHAEPVRRPGAPFVAVNCGAVARELFASELFGHVPGAFTGALREGRAGKLELADGGVLCLDEIGEMPLEIQPFLLRVLDERVVYRVGDSKGRPVEFDLVALTNRDLKAEVEAGRFRRDLYYRISALTISVPPLRERGDDVALLVDHLNRQIAAQTGQELLRFTDAVMAALLAWRWPGNVRELKNLIVRLHLVVTERTVSLAHLPVEMVEPTPSPLPARPLSVARGAPVSTATRLDDATRTAIDRAIADQGGNLSKAARALGISRPTLYRKLRLYGLEP